MQLVVSMAKKTNSFLFLANSITSSKDFDWIYICLDIISICLDVSVTNSELDSFSRCLYLFTPPNPAFLMDKGIGSAENHSIDIIISILHIFKN